MIHVLSLCAAIHRAILNPRYETRNIAFSNLEREKKRRGGKKKMMKKDDEKKVKKPKGETQGKGADSRILSAFLAYSSVLVLHAGSLALLLPYHQNAPRRSLPKRCLPWA
jgi:hypothetical protein